MINLRFEDLERKNDCLILEDGNIIIGFSTAEENRSFNRNTDEGRECLNSLKEEFEVNEIFYLKQIHSDVIYTCNKEEKFNEREGDAIITEERNIMIGAFTADCVPIIIKCGNVIGAVHSGWKGTISNIVYKTLSKMEKEFEISKDEVKVYIGPHIRKCCYEISEELKDRFLNETKIEEKELFDGRNLSMEKVIERDCLKFGVKEENIFSLNLCTYCEEKIKLHSYRKSDGAYGRLFTFAIIK
ncbi:MAG: polyphenol oxidase family protein [Clostridium sp.]|uniref:polyphenol oxidase family protein n=1 Tax=Clostridium sp. TaxID=1506 RepID=UPI003EE71C4C